jgi:hypothetical protein
LEEYVSGGKAIDTQNLGEAKATGKVLMQQIAKTEAEEASAFDTMGVSAIRSLEFAEKVDAYKLKPLYEITDRLIVTGQGSGKHRGDNKGGEKREKLVGGNGKLLNCCILIHSNGGRYRMLGIVGRKMMRAC